MFRKMLICAALLSSLNTAWALRVLEDVENSVEISLGELTLPSQIGSAVLFKTCASCRTESHPTNAATKFLVNGQEQKFEDFVRTVTAGRASATTNDRAVVGVYYDLKTKAVTRVTLHIPR